MGAPEENRLSTGDIERFTVDKFKERIENAAEQHGLLHFRSRVDRYQDDFLCHRHIVGGDVVLLPERLTEVFSSHTIDGV
jgi:hypothetical protein